MSSLTPSATRTLRTSGRRGSASWYPTSDHCTSTQRWGTLRARDPNSTSCTPTRKCEYRYGRDLTESPRGTLRDLLGPHTSYDFWHIDQTFTQNVPSTTFFWVLESPANGGGDTAFTSLTAAYEALSPSYRATLADLEIEHTSASRGEVARVGTERALKESVNATHPLVIAHPVTRKPALFVNPAMGRTVKGFKPEESDHLLGFLHNHIKSLDFSCRVRWARGTVVVWDQRTAAHTAIPDFEAGARRHMVRIIPYGAKPTFARDEPVAA